MKKDISIGIIGFGRLGALAASILKKEKFDVQVYDPEQNEELMQKARLIGVELVPLAQAAQNDIVVLAAPISATEAVIKQIVPLVKPGTLVLDTCSVKIHPCNWLKENFMEEVEILGTHPMFGPVTTKFDLQAQQWELENLQIVLCPLRVSAKRMDGIKEFLASLGLKVIITTPQEHDRQNAYTLSLVHFVGRALNEVGVKEQEIFTPGYTDLLRILPHTTSDNWQLFFDMHQYNPYAQDIRKQFIDACLMLERKIDDIVAAEDEFLHARKTIDKLDTQILDLLFQRFQYVEIIGKIKKQNGLPVVDKERERKIIEQRVKTGKLDKEFIEKFYSLVFAEAYKRQ
jgi:prephenate dehydrogenase